MDNPNLYKDNKAEELINDEYFIQSISNPTLESNAFWEERIRLNQIDIKEFSIAKEFILSIRFEKKQLPDRDIHKLWNKITHTNRKYKKKTKFIHLVFYVSAACAALIFILSVGNRYLLNNKYDIIEIAKALNLEESENIQLILSDNYSIPVEEQNPSIQYDSTGKIKINSQIVQTNQEKETLKNNKIQQEYNQLVVPNGKRSSLTLMDGSKLWVNAGSRIVYPTAFTSTTREIFIDGEAYLEITPDKNKPFIVKTGSMTVKVLGTSFNIMSYKTDEMQSVVLVSGAVQVSANNKSYDLIPNEMFSMENGNCHINVVNPYDYIIWKDGLYKYNSENLSIILERLTRYYRKTILYDDDVAQLKCTGKLDMKEDIELVLNGLCQTAPIRLVKEQNQYRILLK